MAIISGYPNDLYSGLFAGWEVIERKAAKDNGTKEAVECLWLSPNLQARASQKKLF
jgi:hypothetical protein